MVGGKKKRKGLERKEKERSVGGLDGCVAKGRGWGEKRGRESSGCGFCLALEVGCDVLEGWDCRFGG